MDTHGTEWLTPPEFLKRHPGRLGRWTLYEGLRRGEIPHVKIGRRLLVPSDLFERLAAASTGKEAAR